ncbi:Hsp33 family molecular chaperone HslO [Paracoccaceae bacterium GXU_MW_L88]
MMDASTETKTLRQDDMILPFQLDRADIRGRVVRLDEALQTILDQHNYPLPVQALVAEAAVLTALIGQTVKLRWRLSLQVRGDGPIRLIATDYYAPAAEGEPATIRAYASFDEEALDDREPFQMLGKGMFAIVIHQGEDMQPYQGITPLVGTSLADCAETYFAQSEQLPSRFAIGYGENHMQGQAPGWRAGGIMLQHLPKAGLHAQGDADESGMPKPEDLLQGQDSENWNRATMLMETVELTELIGPHVPTEELLLRLFHEEQPRIYDRQPVNFGCTCSEERVRNSLSIYSAKDIAHMTTDEGDVTADCQFCGAHYVLDPKTVGFEAES